MATRLIQTLAFAAVPAGGSAALPHTINVNGVATVPDFVAADQPGFTVTATALTVAVTNTGTAPASVNVWLELKHTIPRQLGSTDATLTPQPFVVASGSGGGGSGPLPVDQQMRFYDDLMSGGAWWYEFDTDLQATIVFNPYNVTPVGPQVGFAQLGVNVGSLGDGEAGVALMPSAQVTSGGQGSAGGAYGLGPVDLSFDGVARTEWRVQYSDAPAVGNDYATYVGLYYNAGAAVKPTKGPFFRAGVDENGTSTWWAVTIHEVGDETEVDTNVPVTADWVRLAIEVETSGGGTASTTTFYIDGTIVATVTKAKIYDNPHMIPAVVLNRSQLDYTGHSVLVDYLDFTYTLDRS